MSFDIGNRLAETSVTEGQGTYTLGGPIQGFQAFSTELASGAASTFVVFDPSDTTVWEVIRGTYTAGPPSTLTRDVIESSTAGGAAINWGPGTRSIFQVISAGALAGLLSDVPGLIARTGLNSYAERAIQATSPLNVADGDGVAGDPSLSLSLGGGLKLLGTDLVSTLPTSVELIGFTANASYRATLVLASGTFTMALTAAATLGDDWWTAVRNTGAGVITVDPNAAETIDGVATITLVPGETALIVCDGTAFHTVGRAQEMAGASAGSAGRRGIVPPPQAGDQAKALLGDGTWGEVAAGGGGGGGSGGGAWKPLDTQAGVALSTAYTTLSQDISNAAFVRYYARIVYTVDQINTEVRMRVKIGGAVKSDATYETVAVTAKSSGAGPFNANKTNLDYVAASGSTDATFLADNKANAKHVVEIWLDATTSSSEIPSGQFRHTVWGNAADNIVGYWGSFGYDGAVGPVEAIALATGAGTATVDRVDWYGLLAGTGPADPTMLTGLTIANNTTDAAHDIDIAAGSAGSEGGILLSLAATMTKQLDAAWAAGNNAGGLFSGAIAASTWYHVFVIRKDSDGSIDAGFDTDIGAANIPAGYTEFRRIGSVKTDGASAILAFVQSGNWFHWSSPVLDINTLTGATNLTQVINVPPGVECQADISCTITRSGGNTRAVQFWHPGITAPPLPASGAAPFAALQVSAGTVDGRVRVPTDDQSTIRITTNASTVIVDGSVIAYRDHRGTER